MSTHIIKTVKEGESFAINAKSFSIYNQNNTTPKLYQSLPITPEVFKDTNETLLSQDITNIDVGISDLVFKIGTAPGVNNYIVYYNKYD